MTTDYSVVTRPPQARDSIVMHPSPNNRLWVLRYNVEALTRNLVLDLVTEIYSTTLSRAGGGIDAARLGRLVARRAHARVAVATARAAARERARARVAARAVAAQAVATAQAGARVAHPWCEKIADAFCSVSRVPLFSGCFDVARKNRFLTRTVSAFI